ncbi:MAG: LacI family transcriptional regulator [Rhodothermales bacterium]|jgi:LacI family transcriptional regulator
MSNVREIALILSINKPYDRQIIAGVSAYTRTVENWSLYLEDDSLEMIPDLSTWQGDGVIADFDDTRVAEALKGLSIPIVGLGGGFRGSNPGVPNVYYDTDNEAIAKLAFDHFAERGFSRFGFCGVPQTAINRWAQERGDCFKRVASEARFSCSVYNGRYSSPRQWRAMQKSLQRWLKTLVPPVAILACNDARARHVLEACKRIGLRVPEDVAVLGVDNDSLMCELATPQLSSVAQGTDRLGYEAAAMLDRLIDGEVHEADRFVIPPAQVMTRHSTEVMAIDDTLISAALLYISKNACSCIQVDDVARQVRCSRSTLEKRFRAVLGRSVHAEIGRVQLRRVEELLLRSDLALKEIAVRAGFSSVQYMATVFRKWSGVSPGQYRALRR